MIYFRKILRYGKPFLKHAWLSGVFNILYAIFNILTILAFLPVLSILFKTDSQVYVKPTYNGISKSFDFLKDSFYYEITRHVETEGILATLSIICALLVVLFFFKNLFRYLAT